MDGVALFVTVVVGCLVALVVTGLYLANRGPG